MGGYCEVRRLIAVQTKQLGINTAEYNQIKNSLMNIRKWEHGLMGLMITIGENIVSQNQ